MEIKVKLSNFRTSPRKVRQVIDLVRGKSVPQAQSILLFTVNKSARSVLKLLNSAVASATHDLHLEESNLFISKINETLKLSSKNRFMYISNLLRKNKEALETKKTPFKIHSI